MSRLTFRVQLCRDDFYNCAVLLAVLRLQDSAGHRCACVIVALLPDVRLDDTGPTL